MRTFCLIASLAFVPSLPAQTGNLQSTFVGGLVISNPPPAAATMYFDVNVLNPAGIVITRFDVNTNAPLGTTGTLGVFVTAVGGSHVGNATNPLVWTQVALANVTSAQGRTQVPLLTPFYLAPGAYGVALHHVSLNPVYTNPATPVPPLPATYGNADLVLDMTYGRSRTSLTNAAFGGTAAGNSPRHANVAVFYTIGAVAVDFTATPTRGASPLPVQFTGIGVSGNPGGIVAWAWDFENDGIIDSAQQNPAFTYTACGNYTVALTIVDSAGPHTVTKTNFVQTDVIVPDFTVTRLGPLTLQFNDLCAPAAQTWAWDLDGDGLTDSTQQNPIWVYSSACAEVDVRLTVTRACQPPVTLQRRIAIASALETRFDGNLITVAGATGGANFFDLTVVNPLGVTVCAMHVHSSVGNGQPLTINVWVTNGTYVGNNMNQAVWRLVATSTTVSRGIGQRSFAPFAPGFYLASGSYGVCVEHVGGSPVYINTGVNQTFGNADLSLTAGLTMATPVFTTGTVFTPRIWNGAIYYDTCAVGGAPGYGWFGPGCAGSLPIAGNAAATQPRVGATFTAGIDNLPVGIAFFLLGFSRTTSLFGPLPIDLTVVGAPGCFGRVSPDATTVIAGPGTAATWSLGIPNSAALLCTQFYTQALALDPTANALGGVFSDAAAGVVGQ